MNETMIANIRSSWEIMVEDGLENMMMFYDKLFQIAPQVRPMFPEDLSKQSEKLAYTITFVVTNIDRIEEIKGSIEDLGRIHNKLDISADYYPPVKEALIWTIEQKMADKYKAEIGEAWNAALDFLASVMINAPAKRENKLKTLLNKLFG
ncbi:globin domain-containing protein [Marinoscillum sp. MHG1-6]|uniref:globin domain-containing protein n=1 Tax=Marinoscillum sp. MHG1-6 TaxID=2959627 RepID=UPI0021589D9F|nr:globin domain-containing protein [Marinoscillum sp. MHG1-6]